MFIQMVQGRCSRHDGMRDLVEDWCAMMADRPGWLGGTYGFTDDDRFLGIVRFDSAGACKEAASTSQAAILWAGAEDLFDGRPEIHESEDISMMLQGGSDSAGFVQVMKGRVADADRFRHFMTDTEMTSMLHEARPEIIGATLAMEPNGNVHWKLARPLPIGASQWSYEGFRIAYGAGKELRVVNGDGTGDRRLIGDSVGRPFAWRPGTHQLAFVTSRGRLLLMDVDRRRVLWRRRLSEVDQLVWSDDGRRLFAGKHMLDAMGSIVATFPRGSLTNGAFVPKSHAIALVTGADGGNTVTLFSGRRYDRHRVVFSGAGTFAGLAWSPDGRWLLVDYRSADQWLFIRSAGVQRIAVRNIGNTFDSGPEHYATLAGWCCP